MRRAGQPLKILSVASMAYISTDLRLLLEKSVAHFALTAAVPMCRLLTAIFGRSERMTSRLNFGQILVRREVGLSINLAISLLGTTKVRLKYANGFLLLVAVS